MRYIRDLYHRRSFTLIELLISIGIMLMVVTLVAVIFRGALLSWTESQILARSYQTLKSSFLRISKEVSSSVRVDETQILGDIPVFKGDGDSIFFIYPAGDGLREIGYMHDPAKRTLVRRQSKCDFDFVTFDSQQDIGFNVEALEFAFFDGSTWSQSIDVLPQAVKVGLTLRYRNFNATYEETINIPVSR
ncbi:prepilin-type N-terminal cleavage/methylation domain-containing protein [Candidatus Omnitrophota bacterium]